MIKTRFAPSPTGHLHVGNTRVALISFLFAKKNQGSFLLRIDDTDQERSKKEYEMAIIEDLDWMGLTFDHFFRQSERFSRYEEIKNKLIDDGRLYACYETPQELEFKRKRQLAKKMPPIYDRSALSLTQQEKKELEDAGRRPHWRFRLDPGDIHWQDLVRERVHFDAKDLSDPVLIREDGVFLYSFCSVIDDIDYEITHVIRGEDHVSNTASQIQLFEAITKKPCSVNFAHTTLLMDQDGRGLSKRLGSLSLKDLREKGIEPMAIGSLLATLGTSHGMNIHLNLQDLVKDFSLDSFSRAAPCFNEKELWVINERLYHMMNFSDVEKKIKSLGIDGITEEIWKTVHHNISKLEDLRLWQKIFFSELIDYSSCSMDQIEHDFWQIAYETIPQTPWEEYKTYDDIWSAWINRIKEKTKRKGKDLFMPIRKALTGMNHGPEMKSILPLIGKKTVEKRLDYLRKKS
jgi:glutamyl-tRNA synthetase